ncbi:MAG: hypothetical protein PHW07_00165 [Sulfurospirillaceae bacterium]|nr:hypothetical protein [Sulfurospirillaceae bacterium]
MVKIITIVVLFSLSLSAKSVYEQDCMSCHQTMAVKIDKFFYRYLLKYSSEEGVKKAMAQYLKNPTAQKTVLSDGLINRFGVKKPTKLSDKELQEALDEYWEIHKVFGKLK